MLLTSMNFDHHKVWYNTQDVALAPYEIPVLPLPTIPMGTCLHHNVHQFVAEAEITQWDKSVANPPYRGVWRQNSASSDCFVFWKDPKKLTLVLVSERARGS